MDDKLRDSSAEWQYSSQRQQKDSLKRDNRIQANIAENANGENTLISVSATLP